MDLTYQHGLWRRTWQYVKYQIKHIWRIILYFSVRQMKENSIMHDDVIKWKHFPRYWPFVRGIRRSPVNSQHKGQQSEIINTRLFCADKDHSTLFGTQDKILYKFNGLLRKFWWRNRLVFRVCLLFYPFWGGLKGEGVGVGWGSSCTLLL